MKSLFLRIFTAFLAALLILTMIATAVFLAGYGRSLQIWSRNKTDLLEQSVRNILEGKPAEVPEDTPLFIYDADKVLIYSNRGLGRQRQAERGELTAVQGREELIGYYSAGAVHFRSDAANDRFIRSMGRALWISLSGAFSISLLAALLFSRSLAAPARRTAEGLDRMARGDLRTTVPETGAGEISLIARSANRLSRQLAAEQELRRQWAEDVAHDLRTPVSALKAQFEAMRDGVLEVSPERIDKNIREIERIERLVLDLEELTRLDSPEMRPQRRTLQLTDLLGDLEESFALPASEKRVSVTVDAGGVEISADPALLHRALSNVLANAVRHVNEGGEISLAAAQDRGSVRITITNTGQGIPPEELPRLFDRLYRGEKARSSPGSGLGLTIAKKIVDLHGGGIRISSEPRRGAAVEIVLPAAREVSPRPSAGPSGKSPSR